MRLSREAVRRTLCLGTSLFVAVSLIVGVMLPARTAEANDYYYRASSAEWRYVNITIHHKGESVYHVDGRVFQYSAVLRGHEDWANPAGHDREYELVIDDKPWSEVAHQLQIPSGYSTSELVDLRTPIEFVNQNHSLFKIADTAGKSAWLVTTITDWEERELTKALNDTLSDPYPESHVKGSFVVHMLKMKYELYVPIFNLAPATGCVYLKVTQKHDLRSAIHKDLNYSLLRSINSSLNDKAQLAPSAFLHVGRYLRVQVNRQRPRVYVSSYEPDPEWFGPTAGQKIYSNHHITDIFGEVMAWETGELNDEYSPALGENLYEETLLVIGPDSGVEISMPDGKVVYLGPNTIIKVGPAQFEGDNRIGILVGHVWSVFKEVMSTGRMDIEMSQAVAGIKATVFVIEETETESKLTVLEGEVEFTTIDGEVFSVTQGESINYHLLDGVSEISSISIENEIAKVPKHFQAAMITAVTERGIELGEIPEVPDGGGSKTRSTVPIVAAGVLVLLAAGVVGVKSLAK